jgi:hypothetical protein
MSDVQGPPIGYGSAVVNGELIPIAPKSAYDPLIFGSVFAPGGMWPRQGVYNIPPIIPNPDMVSYDVSSGGGVYTSPGSFPTQTDEKGNPFHLTKSPVVWALVALVFSLAMLHFVHYK